jgi:hypothetical protein
MRATSKRRRNFPGGGGGQKYRGATASGPAPIRGQGPRAVEPNSPGSVQCQECGTWVKALSTGGPSSHSAGGWPNNAAKGWYRCEGAGLDAGGRYAYNPPEPTVYKTKLPDTFWAKVNKMAGYRRGLPTECWGWTGAIQSRGYGSFAIDDRSQSTHRLAYIDAKGDIADGLTVDHLCFNTLCVNPDHLEAVTAAENNRRSRVRRGYQIGGTCGRGHDLTLENTRQSLRGQLICLSCQKIHQEAHAERETAKAIARGVVTPRLIREWAARQGMEVGQRGRISEDVRLAYLAAHKAVAA